MVLDRKLVEATSTSIITIAAIISTVNMYQKDHMVCPLSILLTLYASAFLLIYYDRNLL